MSGNNSIPLLWQACSIWQSPFVFQPVLLFTQYTSSITFEIGRRHTHWSRNKTSDKSKATSQSTRPFKGKNGMEKEEEIPSSRSKDQYTESPLCAFMSLSQPLWKVYHVLLVPCWCAIESTRCQTHWVSGPRDTRWFRGYEWQTSPWLSHCYSTTSEVQSSHRMLVECCLSCTNADLTETSHQMLISLFLVITVSGK